MANHGYVTTRRKLTPEQVDQDIREIVKRRFKGEVEVEYEKLSEKPTKRRSEGWEFWNIWASWRFRPKSEELWKKFGGEFSTWIMSHRKLEFRHPHGDWAWWAQMILQDELALKYGGTISDEGVSERWKVTPHMIRKYRHFKNWVFRRWNQRHNKALPKEKRDAYMKMELDFIPEPLRSL